MNIPGWVLVALAGLGILLLGIAQAAPAKVQTARKLGFAAAVCGALLALLAFLEAVYS
jgi:hypothetical protein